MVGGCHHVVGVMGDRTPRPELLGTGMDWKKRSVTRYLQDILFWMDGGYKLDREQLSLLERIMGEQEHIGKTYQSLVMTERWRLLNEEGYKDTKKAYADAMTAVAAAEGTDERVISEAINEWLQGKRQEAKKRKANNHTPKGKEEVGGGWYVLDSPPQRGKHGYWSHMFDMYVADIKPGETFAKDFPTKAEAQQAQQNFSGYARTDCRRDKWYDGHGRANPKYRTHVESLPNGKFQFSVHRLR